MRSTPTSTPSQTVAAPFQDLVEESFAEAVFLWRRWEHELTSLTRNLDEVWSWTEDRLHGALDGVRVGGASAIELARNAVHGDEIDPITVGTAVLGSTTDHGAIEIVTAALKDAKGEKLSAMLRGLELLGSDQALRATASVLMSPEPSFAAALCRLKAFRRVAPGDELTTAFTSKNPAAQVDAIRATRLVSSGAADEWVASALHSDDAAVRYAAVESGVSLRMAHAWDAATRFAGRRDPTAGPYLNLLGIFGAAAEHEVVFNALRIPGLQPAAIWALGHIGNVRAAEACIAGMQHEPLARACGEAYCWMTGADLVRDRLAVEETPGDAPAFQDDDLDANLVPAPEALWPLPDPDAVRKHWLKHGSDWSATVRHVRGRPVSGDTLLDVIETGPMLRRPDLVLELRVKTRGRYDVETRAFTPRQRQMMAAGRSTASGHGGR
jgi:uncharacterized protein (TIGR02270 family)